MHSKEIMSHIDKMLERNGAILKSIVGCMCSTAVEHIALDQEGFGTIPAM